MTASLLSPRAASRLTKIPWLELRAELERAGYRIIRIGVRDRVAEADLAALIERGRQPTAVEVAANTEAALAEACRELGIAPKRARKRREGAAS
jgi:hypothetical protein